MSGNKESALRAKATLLSRFGADYYLKIGTKGGKSPKTKPFGFGLMPLERRREVARKGGSAKPSKVISEEMS